MTIPGRYDRMSEFGVVAWAASEGGCDLQHGWSKDCDRQKGDSCNLKCRMPVAEDEQQNTAAHGGYWGQRP